jgi:hypothetical protein
MCIHFITIIAITYIYIDIYKHIYKYLLSICSSRRRSGFNRFDLIFSISYHFGNNMTCIYTNFNLYVCINLYVYHRYSYYLNKIIKSNDILYMYVYRFNRFDLIFSISYHFGNNMTNPVLLLLSFFFIHKCRDMYIYKYVYMYVYTYIYVYIHIYIYIYIVIILATT